MTKEKDDAYVQKMRIRIIILLYSTKGNNMSIFNDPEFYYNDLSHTIADKITRLLKTGVSSSRAFALWEHPIFIDAEDDLIQWGFDVQYVDDRPPMLAQKVR